MYMEEDYLMLSGIQHFVFCRRQWALIHIEQQWIENLGTVEGRILHERAHDTQREVRNGVIITRSLQVFSCTLGIRGVCDIVEMHPDPEGITFPGVKGLYMPVPIEYKRGSPKEHDADVLQLCAQAMCLEEMLVCNIPKGYIFYGQTKRRLLVDFNEELRRKVTSIFCEMHEYFHRGYTPKSKYKATCKSCSLVDICLPKMKTKCSVEKYINTNISEGEIIT